MQMEVPNVIDLAKETRQTLEMYGLNDPDTKTFGRHCLMAQRVRRMNSDQRPSKSSTPLRDLHVTLLHLLGLDDNKLTYFHGGRFKQLAIRRRSDPRLKPGMSRTYRTPASKTIRISTIEAGIEKGSALVLSHKAAEPQSLPVTATRARLTRGRADLTIRVRGITCCQWA